ncbi:MAG: DUF2169 domain-containing protein [Planctomycetes bacterium]|nr:DUF2169 domain-containing protein [Planctomycetota bacterium]MCW8135172.1 DUF2169 domain-containing protein [Planctomycetota bacterium]
MEIRNRTTFAFAPVMGRVNFPAHTATLVVKATFQLAHRGSVQPVTEQPALEGDVLSKGKVPECLYEADLAPYKPRTDLLLSGTCYTPGGKPAQTCPVAFKVGAFSKTLACIGNRVWHKGMVFAKVGEIEPFNALPVTWANAFGGPKFAGNPAGKGAKDGVLPNIEHPARLITGYGDKPEPAGFGPVHRTWKLRADKLGTYDKKWLKERFPAFAADFDWTYFNAAPKDQQLEGFLRGDEELELLNLHPQHEVLKTRLPGLAVRVLLREGRDGADAAVREVPMNLDTLLVDADEGVVHLLWRGVANVSDEDWLECREILVVADPLTQPRSLEQLVPLFDEPAEETEVEDAPETPEMRAARVQAFEKEVAAIEKMADGHAKQAESAATAKLKGELDIPKAAAKPAGPGDLKSLIDRMLKSPEAARMGLPRSLKASDLDIMADPDVKEALALAKSAKALKPTDTKALMGVLKSGEAKGGDFSGGLLGGQDLKGADLSECYFNDADFSGADLSGANLSGASLLRANLSGADISGANLSDADLSGADLSGAKLDGAILNDTVLLDAQAEGASFAGAKGGDAIFIGLKAPKAVFTGTELGDAVFSNAQLAGADFSGASLKDAAFDNVSAVGAKFEGAQLAGLRGSEGSDFSDAVFTGAAAPGSVWENSVLKGADFRQCNLKDAQFSFADLTGAKLFGADLSGAMLRKAVLANAEAGNANFFQALLEKADLSNASLIASNFFEAEFHEAKTKGADFNGANLKMTKLAK